MSKRLLFDGGPTCMRCAYFGLTTRATLNKGDDPSHVPMYCGDCHRFLYPNFYTARGGVEQSDPQNQPTIDKEA